MSNYASVYQHMVTQTVVPSCIGRLCFLIPNSYLLFHDFFIYLSKLPGQLS